MAPAHPAPLILTLGLDADSQAHFTALRTRHFPPERNHLAAHLTLFHALPGAAQAHIDVLVRQAAAAQAGSLPLTVKRVLLLGQGVAYGVDSPALVALHAALQQAFAARFPLTPQDQRRLNPHITVQNKATPAAARALFTEFSLSFQPTEIRGTGLELWRYRGGPWEALTAFPF